MCLKLYYFESVKDKNNYIYSCDSIRLEFQLKPYSDLMISISQYLLSLCDEYYISFKTFSYKYCFNFLLSDDISFTVLVGLNTFGKLKSCFVVDFNPNKCMHFDIFKNIISQLFYICKNFKFHDCITNVFIKRYDIAVDVPCERRNLSVVWTGKSKKRHEIVQTTVDDKTEYFGKRNSVGRIKIYNKSLEDIQKQSKEKKELYRSGVGERLTRIEVTHNTLDSMVLYSAFPCAFTRYDINFLPDCLNATDYILVNACRHNDDYLYHLKSMRVKWHKLKKYIVSEPIQYDIDCISDILFQVSCYTSVDMYTSVSFQELADWYDKCSKSLYDLSIIDFPQDKIIDCLLYDDDSQTYEELQLFNAECDNDV